MLARTLTLTIALAMTAGLAAAQGNKAAPENGPLTGPLSGPGAALAGTVTDEAGLSLPSVTVTAVSRSGEETAVVTADDGAFAFPRLAAGAYTVSAALTGFRTVAISDLDLRDGGGLTLPISLTLEPIHLALVVTKYK
jgi:hypothetical protein